MDFVDVWIGLDDRQEGFFHGEMDLRAGHLLLQATHYRRGQDNVADGAETYDKDLWHATFFAKIRFSTCKLR
jgi:hypothetical protein